jgi:hypothetical protein
MDGRLCTAGYKGRGTTIAIGQAPTCVWLVVRLSTIGSSLCPTGDPDAERLYAGILERSDQPVCASFYEDIGLIRSLSSASCSMNQRNTARERDNAVDFGRQSGALEDAAEKRAVQRGILCPTAKMHPVECDVVGLFGKTLRISRAIATRPRIVQTSQQQANRGLVVNRDCGYTIMFVCQCLGRNTHRGPYTRCVTSAAPPPRRWPWHLRAPSCSRLPPGPCMPVEQSRSAIRKSRGLLCGCRRLLRWPHCRFGVRHRC